MATSEQFDEWLTKYGEAWVALDPDAVMALMDRDDLTYYESTFNEPKTDWSAVNELWQVVPTNQRDVTFVHEILLHDTNRVMAHVEITRTLVPSGENQNIDGGFVFELNETGLCTYFRQWRMLK